MEAARPDWAGRFVGGHPMAGSEQGGLDGADADLFVGATWVLTPTDRTDASVFTTVRRLVAGLGAEVIAVPPGQHDDLVAVVSHVPQLAATTLMDVAAAGGEEHATLLRLAAGGFRDMTRIAAGDPGIWPDICVANRDAIVDALDGYLDALGGVRALVAGRDRDGLLELLERARAARRRLPVGGAADEPLVELRVPVPDRPGHQHLRHRHRPLRRGGRRRPGAPPPGASRRGVRGRAHRAGLPPLAARAPVTPPEELVVEGPRPLRGRVRVPGDKGISHRALLFGSLATGVSELRHLADGDDVARTRAILIELGVPVVVDGTGTVTVTGGGVDALREPGEVLDCANSGTTIRMLCGLLAGRPFHSVLSGDASLRRRPMRRVAAPLRDMGAHVDGRDDARFPPLAVRGGDLVGTRAVLPVASAQVKTALVLAGLQAAGVTEIVEPAPSRDHTERMLDALGAPVERTAPDTVRVTRGAPQAFELDVPGDPSSAAFFVVAAVITPGSELTVEGVDLNPSRLGFVDVLRRMGADVEARVRDTRLGEPVGDLVARAGPLTGTVVSGDEVPNVQDEVPVLAVAAAFAEGVTEFGDVGELRTKESDRIAALAAELGRLGVGVETGDDRLVVRGGRPAAATLDSHGDHRVAMAAAVAGNAAAGVSTVRGWAAVASSYPRFADDLAACTASGR